MFPMEYKREMDALEPSEAAMARLEALTKGESLEKPGRRLGRRAAAVLALCAALAVTAVAAEPSVWSALAEHLGPFGAYLSAAEGTVTHQGVKVELVASLSDSYTAMAYFTATDLTGGRFNDHTRVSARLDGELAGLGGAAGCRVISYDAEQNQLLVQVGLEGLDSGAAVQLEVSDFDPGYYYIQDARFQPPEAALTLAEQMTAEGDVVLKAGQTPQTSPDTADVSISSMGFDEAGNFHIRLALAEGCSDKALLAVPYNAAGEQMGHTAAQTAVEGGVDSVLEGITPADVADMAYIRVYGPYRGPEAVIEGTWVLPVTLEPAEQSTIPMERMLGGGIYVERIQLSNLSAVVFYRSGEREYFPLQITDTQGQTVDVPMAFKSVDKDTALSYAIYRFDQPVELGDIDSVTLLGETIPLTR